MRLALRPSEVSFGAWSPYAENGLNGSSFPAGGPVAGDTGPRGPDSDRDYDKETEYADLFNQTSGDEIGRRRGGLGSEDCRKNSVRPRRPPPQSGRVLLQRLKEQLRDAESRLVDARNRPSDFSRPAASAESDAAALLSGGSLDDLGATIDPPEERDKLVRQMHALQQAIPQAQVKVAETEVAIVAECCRNLEPVVQEFQQDVLDAMTALVAALQKEAVFYRHVATMGWTESLRPAHWALMPWETISLFGGRGNNLPCLAVYVVDRRKVWDIPGKGSE